VIYDNWLRSTDYKNRTAGLAGGCRFGAKDLMIFIPRGPGWLAMACRDGEGNAVDADAIVIEPQVPGEIARQLAAAPTRRLVPFAAEPPAVLPARRARRTSALTSQGQKATTVITSMAFFGISAIAAWITCVSTTNPLTAEALGVVAIVMTVGFFSFMRATAVAMESAGQSGWRQLPPRADPAHPKWPGRHAVTAYHRRYVTPILDMDAGARALWTRAARAASQVQRSEVVKNGLIDSVQVTTVLPYHLWDIAERLARLSALRTRQHALAREVDAADPEVTAVLAPQRRAHEIVSADVDRRVRQLEVFAGLTGKADAAKRRERAFRELTALNEPHRELLSGVGHGTGADELAEQMSVDVEAIIGQADEAVRQASEAGLGLLPPW
jgi:hypothetical protein